METPNQKYLDQFIGNLKETYQLEKVKKWEKERLEGEMNRIRVKRKRFEVTFPSSDSIWQGELREYASDTGDEKSSLTPVEHNRLEQATNSIEGDINIAMGHRKDKNKEYRKELLKEISDLADTLRSLLSIVRQLVPWN